MKQVLRRLLSGSNDTVQVAEKKETLLSESAQQVFNKYPKEVIEIHNKFNNEAELLLKQATDSISKIIIDPKIEDKSKLASRFGFTRAKEVVESNKKFREMTKHESILKAINMAKEYISDYKWIPDSSVERICKEYNLVFGNAGDYKGFLPNANLLDIEKFADKHEDKLYYALNLYRGVYIKALFFKTQIDYDIFLEKELEIFSDYNYSGRNSIKELKICAPLKDMRVEGKIIENGYKVKDIPDPIVLARRDFNGIEGYYIVTAWGDEANDYEVR